MQPLYAEGRRVLPDRVPVGHLGATEKKLIFEDGKTDRRLYEIATLTRLRDRLHWRDVLVEGSRSFLTNRGVGSGWGRNDTLKLIECVRLCRGAHLDACFTGVAKRAAVSLGVWFLSYGARCELFRHLSE